MVDAKERIPVYPLDVYCVSDKGVEELKGGSTALAPGDLELLVLIDGQANVKEITERAPNLVPGEIPDMLRRLIQEGLIKPAPMVEKDFSYFFDADKPAPEPSASTQAEAAKEAETGTPELQQLGYYVSIARRAASPRPIAPGTTLSVLSVEDDPHLSKLLRQLLEMEGYAARIASNRAEIVAELRRLPSPDLVLLDIVLPDANGFDILQRMKQHPALRSIPVIMVTSRATRESVMRGLAGGADGYVTKPFDPEILMKGIRAVLGLS